MAIFIFHVCGGGEIFRADALYSSFQKQPISDKRGIDGGIIYNVSAMDWLLAVSYWLLAIGTIGAIRVIGSLISNF